MYLLLNFNHERFVISASTCRFARLCYAEALSLGAGGKKKGGGAWGYLYPLIYWGYHHLQDRTG
jgi:hypothetical protein